MAENVRPPVAIRIVRPYETEDALLEHELDTIGKTSVVLIGAHPRPTGVILRFEVTLASGATVLRGEGRVLAHKDNAFRGQAGLTLRFTRLDPRSKAVVDRATSMREQRQAEGGTPSRPAPRPEGAIAEALTASTPAPAAVASASGAPLPTNQAEQEAAVAQARASARERANAQARANARRIGGTIPPTGKTMALTPPPLPVSEVPDADLSDAPAPEPTPVTSIPGEVRPVSAAPLAAAYPSGAPVTAPTISAPPLRSTRAAASSGRAPAPAAVEVPREVVSSASPSSPSGPSRSALAAPPDRAELLARLRERAGNLAPERVQEILASRR